MHTAGSPETERLSGTIERVTFHSLESGFCALRVTVQGQREGKRKINAHFCQAEGYGWPSELSNALALGPRLGSFRAINRSYAADFETFWSIARVRSKEDCRLGAEPD